MTLPVEYITKFRGVKQFEKDQPQDNNYVNFGSVANPSVRVVYNLTDIATDPISKNITLVVWIAYYGSAPTGSIRAFLEESGTPIIQAPETYSSGNVGPVPTPIVFTFALDNYSPGYEVDGQFEIVIDTSSTSNAVYSIRYTTNDVDLESYFQQWQGGIPGAYVTVGDLRFQLFYSRAKEFDISQYVKSIKIDRGMSDIDGQFVEGEADLGLFNRDNRFSPLNQSSPYYEYWDVEAVVTITAIYQSTTYALFKGFIDRIRPDYEIEKRDVYISLSDYFARFKEKKISLNVTTNETPDALIGFLLDALGVPIAERDLDIREIQAMRTINWSNETGFDAISEVVESGQHSHFIGPDGKYYFRTNNWPEYKPTPDYDWESCDVDDFKIEQDKKGIKNKFRVGNSTIGYFTLPVSSSIARYGQKDQDVDNELIPTLGYAQEICLNLQSRFSGRVNGIDLTLKNRLPEILTMDVGKTVAFTEPLSGLDHDRFIPLGLTYDIRPAGDAELSMKLKRFYFPPTDFETGSKVGLVGPLITGFKFERFKMPVTGYITRMEAKIYISNAATGSSYLAIYGDNAGIPGGLIDLSSNQIISGPGTFDLARTMGILGNKLYLKDNYYWAAVLLTAPTAIFQMYGSDPGDYPDGYAYTTGGGTLPTIDFWFKLRIYPYPL